ncbi:hypothetical protein EE612_016551 [Oryza sativa]|nr:hypothetical protein EE612_016551 [Oryza sativa]
MEEAEEMQVERMQEEVEGGGADTDKLSYEIFSILESKFLFGYTDPHQLWLPKAPAAQASAATAVPSGKAAQRGKVSPPPPQSRTCFTTSTSSRSCAASRTSSCSPSGDAPPVARGPRPTPTSDACAAGVPRIGRAPSRASPPTAPPTSSTTPWRAPSGSAARPTTCAFRRNGRACRRAGRTGSTTQPRRTCTRCSRRRTRC